jgi:hypothetical protein
MKLLRGQSWITVISFGLATVLLVQAPVAGLAETPKHSGDEKEVSEPRPEVIPQIKKNDAQLLGYYFSWPERLISQKFKDALPSALSSLTSDKNGAALSKIFAELYATQIPSQVKSIVGKAEALIKEREKTDSETAAKSGSNAMLEKLVDAGKWLLAENTGTNTPERKEFLTQFESDWKERLEKNEKAIAMRDEALKTDSNDATRQNATAWLQKEINKDQLGAFVSGLIRNGKEEEAGKWIAAYYGTDKNGKIVANLKNGGNVVSIIAGKAPQEAVEAFKAYESKSPANAGLYSMTAMTNAEAQAQKPGKVFEMSNGALSEIEAAPSEGAVLAEKARQTGDADTEAKPTAVTKPPSKSAANPAARLVSTNPRRNSNSFGGPAAYSKFCGGCHAPGTKSGSAMFSSVSAGRMPDVNSDQRRQWDAASPAEKNALLAYLRSL